MDRDRFFDLIDAAREGVEDVAPSADADELRVLLEPLENEELLDFAAVLRDELVRLDTPSVRAAGSVIADGMSDDGFHAFRCWLVGLGAAAVQTALTTPDELDAYLEVDAAHGNAALEAAVSDLLDERGLPDPRLDADAAPPEDEPSGEPVEEQDPEARFPRLTARRNAPPPSP